MFLTHNEIMKSTDWTSHIDPDSTQNAGTQYTADDGLTYIWGNENQRYFIIKSGELEIARIGHGSVHGMIYLTGEGELTATIHNAILAKHDSDYSVATGADGNLSVFLDGEELASLNGIPLENPLVTVGSIFFQRMYGYGVYSHYERDSNQAMYTYIDFDIDILGYNN